MAIEYGLRFSWTHRGSRYHRTVAYGSRHEAKHEQQRHPHGELMQREIGDWTPVTGEHGI